MQSRFDTGDGADHGWDAALVIRGVRAGPHQTRPLVEETQKLQIVSLTRCIATSGR